MKISPHFTLKGFACTDGTPYPSNLIENRLTPSCEAVEMIRAELGDKSLTVTSGYRSEAYNSAVGGAKRSQHVQGRAADIKVKGVPTRRVQQKIKALTEDGRIPLGGLGWYKSFGAIGRRGDRKSRLPERRSANIGSLRNNT